ncbi:MAG: DUF5678 domain-containing protein [Vicinamibacterales bacterium]
MVALRVESAEMTEANLPRRSLAVKTRKRRFRLDGQLGHLADAIERSLDRTYVLNLVLVGPNGATPIELPITFQRQAPVRSRVRSVGSDPSGAIEVDLDFDVGTGELKINLRFGDLAGRSLADAAGAARFLQALRAPTKLGLTIPGKEMRSEYLMAVSLTEPILDPEIVESIEALDRVVAAAGGGDFNVPDRLTASEWDAVSKADRLLAGDIVHHSWNEMTLHATAQAAKEMLDGVLSGQAAIDLNVPLEVKVGESAFSISDRWMRVRSALATNKDDARSQAETDEMVEIHLVPGRSDQALSKLGDFPPRGSAGPFGGRQAEALRPFVGQWVATRDFEVVAHAPSLEELLEELRSSGQKADAVVKVPTRGDLDVAGPR